MFSKQRVLGAKRRFSKNVKSSHGNEVRSVPTYGGEKH